MALQPAGMANQNVPIFEPNSETLWSAFIYQNPIPIVNNADTGIDLGDLQSYVTPDKFAYVLVDFIFSFSCNNLPNPATECFIFNVTGVNDYNDNQNIVQCSTSNWVVAGGEATYYAHITGILLIEPTVAPIPNEWIGMSIRRVGNVANNVTLTGYTVKSKLLDRYLEDPDPQAVGLGSKKLKVVSK